MVLLNMSLLWYILLFNGNWQIGTSDGIYEMNWYADELRVEKSGECQWKIINGEYNNC